MKMKEMCFQPFLANIKDSAAWIELGRSFEGTVNVKVHESFIIGRMQNVSIDQFHVDVTVTSLAAARALWWQKHTVTSGVKREKSTE